MGVDFGGFGGSSLMCIIGTLVGIGVVERGRVEMVCVRGGSDYRGVALVMTGLATGLEGEPV
jgi:hypothetical protein